MIVEKTTTLRCRRVRFKNGHSIEMLRPKHEDVAGRFRDATDRAVSENQSPMIGYAIVTWHQDGTVFPAYHNGERSQLQAGQVPQYAKDVLLAEVAARWAKD
jgi:hypothetical protein